MSKKRVVREAGKPPLHLLMMNCLDEVAAALLHGLKKPGRGAFNWQEQQVLEVDMIGGALRHIKAHATGKRFDGKSRRRHLAHAVARLLIAMDAEDHGNLATRFSQAKRKG